jgi:hypothetical protein
MGFFDSTGGYGGSDGSGYNYDPSLAAAIQNYGAGDATAQQYRQGYLGNYNWGDAGNTQSQLFSTQGEDPNVLSRLLETWAGTNDPTFQQTMAGRLGSGPTGDGGGSGPDRQALLDYMQQKMGAGEYAWAQTRMGGSDSDGGGLRYDLVRRGSNGQWTPVEGAAISGSDTGYKSDGYKIGSILASFATAGALNGWGEAGSAATGAGAGAAEAGGAAYGTGGWEAIAAGSPEYAAVGGGAGAGASVGSSDLASNGSTWETVGNGAGQGGWTPGAEEAAAGTGTGAVSGGGGGEATAANSSSTYQPEYNFDTNGLPNGSSYANDFGGTGLAGSGATATAAGSGGLSSYIPAATQALNALYQSYQSNKAQNALIEAGNQSNATQRYIFDTLRADQAPYRTSGYNALDRINGLMKDPSSVRDDPGYQFGLNEGQRSIDNSASARGGIGGAALKAGSRFNTDYATTKLNDVFNRNATIAGFGQVANQQGAQTGMNYGNNVSNIQMGQGNALAGNHLNQGNIYGNLLNQYGANYGRGY